MLKSSVSTPSIDKKQDAHPFRRQPSPEKNEHITDEFIVEFNHPKLQILFSTGNEEILHSLKLTTKNPENRPSQKDIHFPTIHFLEQTVSFREGIYTPVHENDLSHSKDALWVLKLLS